MVVAWVAFTLGVLGLVGSIVSGLFVIFMRAAHKRELEIMHYNDKQLARAIELVTLGSAPQISVVDEIPRDKKGMN